MGPVTSPQKKWSTKRITEPAWARIMDRIEVDPETACWIYQGRIHATGYGQIDIPRTETQKAHAVYTHRVMYEHHKGPIPAGLEIDHLCRVRACCNPDHLEAVTHRENDLRGQAPSVISWRTNTCKRGHSLADAYQSKSGRVCRTCDLAAQADYRRRRRDARGRS